MGIFSCATAFGVVASDSRAGGFFADSPPLVVLELFTSHSCYSCPAAEKLLGDRYIPQAGLLPLELHVDYWNDLIYGLAGKWRDEWSKPQFTTRQQRYSVSVRGSVFTPQIIVQGAMPMAGTRSDAIDNAIGRVKQIPATRQFAVRFGGDAQSGFFAQVGGGDFDEVDVLAIIFQKRATAKIGGGENNGKTLTNHNIVTQMAKAKRLTDSELQAIPLDDSQANSAGEGDSLINLADDSHLIFRLPPIESDSEGCAIVVQRQNLGVILGAARCPQINA